VDTSVVAVATKGINGGRGDGDVCMGHFGIVSRYKNIAILLGVSLLRSLT